MNEGEFALLHRPRGSHMQPSVEDNNLFKLERNSRRARKKIVYKICRNVLHTNIKFRVDISWGHFLLFVTQQIVWRELDSPAIRSLSKSVGDFS